MQTVKLQLNWRHQFQFAGYYAAVQQGFYRDAGLNVEIRQAGDGLSPIGSVLKGESDFGIQGPDLVRYRAAGVPVVALAAIFQHSPAMLACRADHGITNLSDLAGKRLRIGPDATDVMDFLRLKGLGTNQFINTYSPLEPDLTVAEMIRGKVDGMLVYLTDEMFTLSNANVATVVFSPREAGIDFYGDVLFTTEKTLTEKPAMVKAFHEATVKGWKYAMAHREEMVELIRAHYSTRHSREHLRFEAAQMARFLEVDLLDIGYMSRTRWQAIVDVYRQLGLVDGEVDLDHFIYDPADEKASMIRYWRETVLAVVVAGIAVILSVYYFRLSRRLRGEVQRRQETEELLRKEVEERKQAARSISAFAELGLQLSAVNTAKEAASLILDVADRLFTWDACNLSLYSPERDELYKVLLIDTVDGKRAEYPPPSNDPRPSALTRQIIDHGAQLILRKTEEFLPGGVPFGNQSRPSASLMFVPMRQGGVVRGVATIQSYKPNAYTEENLQAFQALADYCGGALERLLIQGEREESIRKLQAALGQVKTLSGLLPICAQCKKIRDDRGYWNQVEIYIRDRSDASFTHSICPECAHKLYPELYGQKPGEGAGDGKSTKKQPPEVGGCRVEGKKLN